MNYLSPEIARHAKKTRNTSTKSLAKPGVSCGIFQDCFDADIKYSKKMIDFNKNKNG